MPTAFPAVTVSQTVSRTTTRDILVAKNGNGYEHRMANGINYKRDVWSVSWEGLNTTDKNTVITFLETVSDGSTITWTSPFDTVEKKYVLDGDYSIQDTGGAIFTITCPLRQVYDLT